jgi:patatin-related protein
VSDALRPPAEGCEELRLALVMNGGVSLAVWMGGITNEIYRLVKQKHPVYQQLLDLTHSSARVDVVSGTSAGGVNGAALALALLYNGDFSILRQAWMDTGDIGALLRPVLGDNPGSLLMGDDYFLPGIQRAFADLVGQSSVNVSAHPIELRLTTTLLTGKRGKTVDDLGVDINDVDYRAQFRFTHNAEHSDFAEPEKIIAKLSRAARSTASFPLAFEPSLISLESELEAHLLDANNESLAVPRYVVDGGLLDNKPFDGALSAIFRMERSGCVRRVLAYINPDPGDGPEGEPTGQSMPSFGTVIADSVFGIPQSQSISDQLTAIRNHNEETRARRDSVATLAQLSDDDFETLPARLFDVYRERRLSASFDKFVYTALPSAARRNQGSASGLKLIGKNGREQLKSVFAKADFSHWLPTEWPRESRHPANQSDSWGWGLFPVEFAAKVMLDLLRRAQNLADYAAPVVDVRQRRKRTRSREFRQLQWRDPPTSNAATQNMDGAEWQGSSREWDVDCESECQTGPLLSNRLAELWARAYEQVRIIGKLRLDERETWNIKTDELLVKLATVVNSTVAGAMKEPKPAVTKADFEQMFGFLNDEKRTKTCGDSAYAIAAVINGAASEAIRIAHCSLASRRLRSADIDEAKRVLLLARRLRGCASSSTADIARSTNDSIQRTLYRLLQLEVLVFAFNDHASLDSDAVIELAQFSGNAASPLGGPCKASSKLLGLQMAHFGAFYKQSWRANDWTYGRLDGAERLVRILLNPERLHRFYFQRRHDAVRDIRKIALDSIEPAILRDALEQVWEEKRYAEKISQELAFLDDLEAQLPDALCVCAAAITERLHYGILRDELPHLMLSIAADQGAGGSVSSQSEALIHGFGENGTASPSSRPFSPEQARNILRKGLIAKERLETEAGSDLFTRTLTHTAGTMQNLLSSKASKLGLVSTLFASLKLPILGFHFVAQGLTKQSRTSAALNGGLLAAGATLVFVAFQWSTMPSLFVTAGWLLFSYGLLASVLKTPFSLGLAVFALLAVAAALTKGLLLVVTVCCLILLGASVRWSGLRWLQWAIGGIAVLVLAGYQVHVFSTSERSSPDTVNVFVLAVVVCAGLAVAVWQSLPESAQTETWARMHLEELFANTKKAPKSTEKPRI